MDLSLRSAFSIKVNWIQEGLFVAKCFNDTECETKSGTGNSIVFINLRPGTRYEINVLTDNDEFNEYFYTHEYVTPHLHNLYESIRREDDVYDATGFNQYTHDTFLKHFDEIVNDGDNILTNVVVQNDIKKSVYANTVTSGSNINVSGTGNIFLPFTADSIGSQTVTLNDNDDKQSLELVYDPTTDSFGINGNIYGVGDELSIFGRNVLVADGSIILIFEDSVALTYPFADTTLDVIFDQGSQFSKNVNCNVLNIIGSKTDNTSGNTYSSSYVHNTESSTTTETTRVIHSLDENEENGTLSIGVRHTDFIEPVIQAGYNETIISNDTSSATIDSSGLSFDHDDCSIYFGSAKTFRIKFVEGDPSLLQIQSYDQDSETYVTRTEFSS